MPVGDAPSAIAFNPVVNKIYVVNSASNTVSVIDVNSDKKEPNDISVGVGPSAIAVARYTNKIYVANHDSNTVSVIYVNRYDEISKEISKIPVGDGPSAIAVNEYGNAYPSIIYVLNVPSPYANASYNTISVIDGSRDKVTAGITFNIHPADSGGIWCKNKEYPTNTYLYVASGTKCIARPAKGFEFSSWVENLPHNSTVPLNQSAISDSPWNSFLSTLGMKPNDTSATFDVNRFGTFTANFKPVPPSVPPQYWTLIITVVITAIVGWSVPGIIGWIRARTKRKETVKEYDDIINSLSSATDRNSLDRIKNQVIRAYISEKINEFQYKILDEKISEHNKKTIDKTNSEIGQSNNSTHQREYKRSPI